MSFLQRERVIRISPTDDIVVRGRKRFLEYRDLVYMVREANNLPSLRESSAVEQSESIQAGNRDEAKP